jgi:hypothetical protein
MNMADRPRHVGSPSSWPKTWRAAGETGASQDCSYLSFGDGRVKPGHDEV